jgi:insertion element IS1 protein InsB
MPGWGKKNEAEVPLADTLLPAKNGDILEFDELWSFVGSKSQKAWIWLVLCRRTRQVLAYALGDRSAKTCRRLWDRLPPAYRHRRSFSDLWEAYQSVLPARTHHAVGKQEAETNHIERFNNTLRQRLGCLVRQTLSFCKSFAWHGLRLLLFLLRYNRERRDTYLAGSPASA